MKLVYQYRAIFFNFLLTVNHFHSLQVENCDSYSRLVVEEDDYDNFRLERVKQNSNIFRHLKLEITQAIPASNEWKTG